MGATLAREVILYKLLYFVKCTNGTKLNAQCFTMNCEYTCQLHSFVFLEMAREEKNYNPPPRHPLASHIGH